MAPLLSASTCHVGDYGKDDEDEEEEEEEEEEKEENGEKEEEEEQKEEEFNLVNHILQLLVRHSLSNPSKHCPELLFKQNFY